MIWGYREGTYAKPIAQSRAPPLQAPLSVLSQLEARAENGVGITIIVFSATCIDSKFDATCGNIVVIKSFFELVNSNPQRSLGGGGEGLADMTI